MLAAAAPASASVRDGVDAWSAGDFASAVQFWSDPAVAGDPDALFNLGQAYRLGRGVVRDMNQARELYRRAAEAGHIRAADTYGLMLFQEGRKQEALSYIVPAAGRGDPRSQYLLGIAHFNGELVERDWEKAYALLTLANGAGLPQAAPAIASMDKHIPLAQRQRAAELAISMKAEADAASAVQFAAADLGVSETQAIAPRVAGRVPAPATRAPVQVAAAPAIPAATPAATPVTAQPSSRYGGEWRVQLGAFGVASNADQLWSRLSSRPELVGSTKLLVPAGRVTKLQAGGYATRAAAQDACNALKAAGQDCLVTR